MLHKIDDIDIGYFHGMFGYIGADGILRKSKYTFEKLCESEKSAGFPEQRERIKVLYN